MKMTHATVQVALALMEQPTGRHWGYDVSKRSGVRSGALYPILHRLLADGLLTDGWEPAPAGRPPRRYYEITERGATELGALLARARADRPSIAPAAAPGFARFGLARPGVA
jgi:PadR family transcriptional regulator PadR